MGNIKDELNDIVIIELYNKIKELEDYMREELINLKTDILACHEDDIERKQKQLKIDVENIQSITIRIKSSIEEVYRI